MAEIKQGPETPRRREITAVDPRLPADLLRTLAEEAKQAQERPEPDDQP